MSKGVLRVEDIAGGQIMDGSRDVFVNGKPAAIIGSNIMAHGPGQHASAIMVQGSSSVFVNGKQLCRMGDLASCGDVGSKASENVFAGG